MTTESDSSPIPRPEYPRPQFERPDWINLNGAFASQSWGYGKTPETVEAFYERLSGLVEAILGPLLGERCFCIAAKDRLAVSWAAWTGIPFW